ncbi:hypothetical protein ES705_16860 [subsurface metagenome]
MISIGAKIVMLVTICAKKDSRETFLFRGVFRSNDDFVFRQEF